MISIETYHNAPNVTSAIQLLKKQVDNEGGYTVEEHHDSKEDVELGGGSRPLQQVHLGTVGIARSVT